MVTTLVQIDSQTYFENNKMELLQSQAPAEMEMLGNSVDRILEIGV